MKASKLIILLTSIIIAVLLTACDSYTTEEGVCIDSRDIRVGTSQECLNTTTIDLPLSLEWYADSHDISTDEALDHAQTNRNTIIARWEVVETE